MRKKSLFKPGLILFFLLFVTTLSAQDKLTEKLKSLRGPVERITVQTENSTEVFEGEEARQLYKELKQSREKERKVKVIVSPDDDKKVKTSKKVIIMNNDDASVESDDVDVFIFKDSDDNFSWETESGIDKKVMVSIKNGEKKVTVTTKENGVEKTEVYEGEDASKYLEELNGKTLEFEVEKSEKDKKVKRIIIEKETKDE